MNVFFEDDGQLKAGTVLADNDASLQVEAASGKRLKVKAAAVLLRFADPAPSTMFADAQRHAALLDPNFLWEVSSDEEFGFDALAIDYYGHVPAPAEAAGVAMALAAAPMYFYKRGKGRYRKAPPEALKAALASVERKKREGEQVALWRDDLCAHRLPDALRAKLPMLLYQPDKNTLEWKALTAACESSKANPVALLAECGAIPSSHEYHFNAFLAQAFPAGVAFPSAGVLPVLPDHPVAPIRAFSIDDATTTEIDDAFSVRHLPNGHCEIGIHIAAPALSIARGSTLDAIARARLSTVYMPGRKITMLPETGRRGIHAGRRPVRPRAVALCRDQGGRHAGSPGHPRRARARRGESAARHRRRRIRQRAAVADRSAVDRRTAHAVEARAVAVRRPRQGRLRADRLQLLRRLGRHVRRRRGGSRAHRSPAARKPARQARLGADDLRQQQLGQAPRRCARRRDSTGRSRTAR